MVPKTTKVKYFRISAREEDSVRDIQQCSAACHLVIIITNTNIDTNITIIINNMVMTMLMMLHCLLCQVNLRSRDWEFSILLKMPPVTPAHSSLETLHLQESDRI